VIVLSDKVISEGMFSIAPKGKIPGLQASAGNEEPEGPYLRYRLTGSGISPMRYPPLPEGVVRVNSHVHSEDGITTEEPGITRAMADKRQKKMEILSREVENLSTVVVSGDRGANIGILCWGSNKWVCSEAGDSLGLRVVRPKIVWPFPAREFASAMNGVTEIYAVETNETAQFARYASIFGYRTKKNVLKYDGRPFTVEELIRELEMAIS
jgi:2-oxoglutarate ferredoxin oxidoreductase subunit alpha